MSITYTSGSSTASQTMVPIEEHNTFFKLTANTFAINNLLYVYGADNRMACYFTIRYSFHMVGFTQESDA
jgi:hypothetical protein